MAVLFANNYSTSLISGINSTDTLLSLADALPFTLGVGDYCYLTLFKIEAGIETVREVVKVTSVVGNQLTVVRGLDGSVATSWPGASRIEMRIVAAYFNDDVVTFSDDIDADTVDGKHASDFAPLSVRATNAVHTFRDNSFGIFNDDGVSTGAIRLSITGLYNQTLSGGMRVLITQTGVSAGSYPDYEFYIAGKWSGTSHTWSNTKARCLTDSSGSINVRFCNDSGNVYLVIGETTSTWNYVRVVVTEVISNSFISGYNPSFTTSIVTTLPATISSTIVCSSYWAKTDTIFGGTY
jgi:hypothetical protein